MVSDGARQMARQIIERHGWWGVSEELLATELQAAFELGVRAAVAGPPDAVEGLCAELDRRLGPAW